MDNTPVSENLNEKNEKNKKNKKLKIIIICSIITLLIVIGIITVYFTVSGKYNKIAENAINNLLLSYQQENSDFTFEPFSCSGLKTIKCKSNSMAYDDLFINYILKEPVITIAPSVNEFNISAKGDLLINITSFAGNTFGSFNSSFDCNDNIKLINERSLMAHNVKCNSLICEKIKSDQQSLIYMKDDAFAENSNMITLFLKSIENDNEVLKRILNSGFVLDNAYNKIYSDNLLQDITDVIAAISNNQNNQYTSDKLINLYSKLKEDYNKVKAVMRMPQEYIDVVDSLISALDGVMFDKNNTLEVQVKYNNSEDIDNMFNSYLLFTPEYYNINIQSYK